MKKGEGSLRSLLDTFYEIDKSLTTLSPDLNKWELVISNMMLNHVEEEVRHAWELSLEDTDVHPLQKLLNFLEVRTRVSSVTKERQDTTNRCVLCKGDHPINNCKKIEALDVQQRRQTVNQSNLCFNCLSAKHSEKEVLLPTVDISIEDDDGKVHCLRVLLDSGSQFNLIPGEVAKKLQMRQKSSSINIRNLRLPNSVDLKISTPDYKKTAKCYVVEKLHVTLPSSRIATSEWKHIEGLELADKQFYEPRKVDLILGVGICSELMADGLIRGTPGQPIAQKTVLGWAISDNTGQRSNAPSYTLYNAAEIIKTKVKGNPKLSEEKIAARKNVSGNNPAFQRREIRGHYTTTTTEIGANHTNPPRRQESRPSSNNQNSSRNNEKGCHTYSIFIRI
ncbi:UNVERIFIED_CONTAM: hypothetical protein PYX00_010492 [Menopon gallinae]|uniref:Peptidase aspartic putative domain-containing protein n=1 Tax=Menopon gallinae TaxID=328185 RepID=A0AAW2HFU0_9NEOP